MRIPYDSLDSTQWMAFSDYASEQGQDKIARFAAKTGKSLEKLVRVGEDPKMVFVYRSTKYSTEYLIHEIKYDPPLKWKLVNLMGYPGFYWATVTQHSRWAPSTFSNDRAPRLCPADFGDPWKFHRVSRRFFATINHRANRLNQKELGSRHPA